jgi:hypothetical protein
MSEENVEVVRRGAQAFGRRDRATYLALHDDEFEVVPIRDWPEPGVRGAEAGWDFYFKIFDAFDWLPKDPTEVVDAGADKVLMHYRLALSGRGSHAGVVFGRASARDPLPLPLPPPLRRPPEEAAFRIPMRWRGPESNWRHHDFQSRKWRRCFGRGCRGFPERVHRRDARGFLQIPVDLGHESDVVTKSRSCGSCPEGRGLRRRPSACKTHGSAAALHALDSRLRRSRPAADHRPSAYSDSPAASRASALSRKTLRRVTWPSVIQATDQKR